MKKFIAMLLAVLMVAGMFAGCGSSESNEDPAVVKIGTTGPLTGENAAYGVAVQAGMEIAVEEINAKGGLQFAFQAQDDEADGEKAVSGYNTLMDWGMDIFCGSVTSGAAAAAAAKCVSDSVFMLTPSASDPNVAAAGDNVFQMCFTDPNQGASAAELIQTRWSDAVIGVIYDSSDAYSSGIYDGFAAKATELGLNVAIVTSFTSADSADLSTQVTQCKDEGCTVVFLPIYYGAASRILNAANSLGYDPTFFGCDGMDGILTIDGFDASLAEDLVLMTPFDANATDEATVSFVNKYKEKMDGLVPNQFAADGYDCIYAIYEALTAAGLDGTASREDICAALVEWFTTTEGFDGLTGSGMTWDEGGMISKAPAAKVIKDGTYVPMD